MFTDLGFDQDEAEQLVLTQAKASSPEQVYDELLVPALVYTKRDRDQNADVFLMEVATKAEHNLVFI